MGLTSAYNTTGVLQTTLLLILIFLSLSSAASNDDKSTMDALLSAVTPTPSGWSSTTHFCNWRGVKCDGNNRVFSLTLPSQSLSGTLPPSLKSLTHLTILSIQNNQFTGPIPSFANLSRLRKLHLDNNSFTSVPRGAFSGLINLEFLSLANNNKLSDWHFPSELSSSPKMVALQASNAKIVGSIPDIFRSFPHLVNLTLSNNNLSGTLPDSFNNSAIRNLKLDNQKLGLTGNIDLLSGMSNLSVLWINGNKFSGVISPSFISLPNLCDIRLENNNFIGPIPHLSKTVELYLGIITPNNSHRNLAAITSSSGKKRNVGAIVGLTFLLVLAVLAFFLWICWKRKSPQPQPLPQPRPQPQPQPQQQPQYQPQPRPQLKPQQRPQPQPHSQPRPQLVPQQRPQPQSQPQPQPQQQQIPQVQAQPRPLHQPQPQPQPQQRPQAQAQAQPRPRPQAQPQQRPQAQAQPQPQRQQRPQAQAQAQVEENSLRLPNKYTYEYLMSVTQDFHQRNKIGGGDFGLVYKGKLSDGTMVAVKCLNFRGIIKDFKNEVDALGRAHHANLVTLLGYCAEGVYRILVYEYMSNDSLDNWIFHEKQRRSLTWPVMKNIILGIAQGLVHLHDNCDKKIMHRDLMPSNVLLDENMNAKLCDFGMAKQIDKDQTSTMTAFARSHRYMAPEMKQGKKITEKVDVYSFGMVVLEILFGKRYFKLVELGEKDVEVDNLPVLIRKNLSVEMRKNANEIEKIGRLAVSCMHENPRDRPSMGIVLAEILEPEASF